MLLQKLLHGWRWVFLLLVLEEVSAALIGFRLPILLIIRKDLLLLFLFA
jgi:hypothetical protein